MIVGPNYVFIAVPRTASMSIASWLIAHHQGVWVGDHHDTEIPGAHRGKFTFAVVRHPYTRLPSLWRYLATVFWPDPLWRLSTEAADWRALGMPFDSNLEEFVHWAATQTGHQWCPQTMMLRDVRLDAVLRFEELPMCLVRMRSCFIYGFGFSKGAQIPHLNQTTPAPLTEAEAWAIRLHSVEDFERFGYSRNPGIGHLEVAA